MLLYRSFISFALLILFIGAGSIHFHTQDLGSRYLWRRGLSDIPVDDYDPLPAKKLYKMFEDDTINLSVEFQPRNLTWESKNPGKVHLRHTRIIGSAIGHEHIGVFVLESGLFGRRRKLFQPRFVFDRRGAFPGGTSIPLCTIAGQDLRLLWRIATGVGKSEKRLGQCQNWIYHFVYQMELQGMIKAGLSDEVMEELDIYPKYFQRPQSQWYKVFSGPLNRPQPDNC